MSVRDALNQKKRLNILQDITHEEGLKVSISFCQDILEHIRGYFEDMNLEISKMKEMKSVNHIEPLIEFVMNSKKKEMLMWVTS
ncbi:MAG: hypothetical protein FWG98_14200 [Candidatus Cloacimonetes bacterium]|nr:hypothetical protein [Candidatus Cloacimonadota bacterium]